MTTRSVREMPKRLFRSGPQREIDVSALLQDGVVVTLSLGRWRAMQRLRKEDLGLGELNDKFVSKFLALGSKTLIPPEIQRRLSNVENSARNRLRHYVFETPFGLFCPSTAYADLEIEMERWRREWLAMRDELVRNLPRYRIEVYRAYRRFARDVTRVVRIDREYGYAAEFARRVVGLIPAEQEISDSFRFDFQVFHVPIPKVLDQRIREQILNDDRSRRIRDMNMRIADKYARDRERLVDGFLRDVNLQLRHLVFESVNNVIGSIDRSGQRSEDGSKVLLGKPAAQLRNMIKRFRQLNILGDDQIEQQIAALDLYLERTPKERDVKEIRGMLQRLSGETRSALLDWGMPVRQVRRLQTDARAGDSAIVAAITPPLRRARRLSDEAVTNAVVESGGNDEDGVRCVRQRSGD